MRLRPALDLVAAASVIFVAVYHLTHAPTLTRGERAGAFVFQLLIAAIFVGRFVYRTRYPSGSFRDR